MQMIYLYDNFFIDHFIQNQIKVKISCGTLAKKQVSLYVDFRIPRESFDNNSKLSCFELLINNCLMRWLQSFKLESSVLLQH